MQKKLGIPAVSGMYTENPGVDMYKKSVFIVPTADSARGMGKAIPAMAKLVLKVLETNGQPGSPEEAATSSAASASTTSRKRSARSAR